MCGLSKSISSSAQRIFGLFMLQSIQRNIAKIREATPIPIAVGFGISDAESARIVSKTADAVVSGSRIIRLLEDSAPGQAVQSLETFIREIRVALDS